MQLSILSFIDGDFNPYIEVAEQMCLKFILVCIIQNNFFKIMGSGYLFLLDNDSFKQVS